MSVGFNDDLLMLSNQKATQLKKEKRVILEKIEALKSRDDETEVVINLAKRWKTADYSKKKEVATLLIHKIIINENGDAKIIWNI